MAGGGFSTSARATNLELLRALVVRADVDLLSLDVFDTLLLRRVARPVDVFAVLGRRLADAGRLPRGVGAPTFAVLRREAETRARARAVAAGRGPEVGLRAVYAEFPDSFGPPEEFVREELRCEKTLVFPDPAVVDLVARARAHGTRVVLTSDTYFSAAHVEYLLGGCLPDAPERIFTSSDHGTGKGSDLFDVVLDHLDVEPHRAVHAGDNEAADVARPRTLGLHVVHLPIEDPGLEHLVRAEGFVLDEALDQAAAPRTFDWVAGDHGLTAVRLRAAGTVDDDDPMGPYRRIGALVLGPVFTGFAEWVVEEARALGAARAYCLMREGAFLTPFIRSVAQSMGVPLEVRPLWLSRHVAARAAVTEVDEPTVRSFLVRRRTPTPRVLAEALGVPARMLASRGRLDVPLDDVMLANQVVARIVGDPEVAAAVAAAAAAARARLGRYLDQALHPDDHDLLLVDLGWNATIQAGFAAALAALPGARTTRGRYLATTRPVASRLLDGLDARGFLVDTGSPMGDAQALVRSPEVFEMVTLPAVGSLRDYTDAGEPVLDPRGVPAGQLEQEAAVRTGIEAFAGLWGRCRPTDPRLGLVHADLALRMIARRFVARPTPAEFARFADWRHEDNFGSTATDRLDHVDPGLDLRYSAATELYRFPNETVYWPAGVLAASAPRLAVGADLALDGFAPEVVGDRPVRRGVVELELDSPAVKSPAWADAARLIANPEARCLARLVTIIPSPTAIRCRIRGDVAAVHVDRIRLVLTRRGADPTVVDVTEPVGDWVAERGRWSGTRLDLDRGEAVLAVAPARLGDCTDVYRIEVALYLRLVDDEVPAR
jgi:FMN phosphatase YigB (HAD superfamily)